MNYFGIPPTDTPAEFIKKLSMVMRTTGICEDDIVRTTTLANGAVVVWYKEEKLPPGVKIDQIISGMHQTTFRVTVDRRPTEKTTAEAREMADALIEAIKTVL